MSYLVCLLLIALCEWIAGQIVGGKGRGNVTAFLLGITGALTVRFCFDVLRITVPETGALVYECFWSETCEPCCETVISGCACEVEYSTHCKGSLSITRCDKVAGYGVGKGNPHCKPCLYHRTPLKDEMSCSAYMGNSRSGSRSSIKRSNAKPDKGHKHAG